MTMSIESLNYLQVEWAMAQERINQNFFSYDNNSLKRECKLHAYGGGDWIRRTGGRIAKKRER